MVESATFNDIVDKAESLNGAGKPWHFHMLGKSCTFNDTKLKFIIVLEDEGSERSFFAVFDKKPASETKLLLDLMLGAAFLDKQPEESLNPKFEKLLARAEEMSSKKIEWHHHYLPPTCIFNSSPEKHCLVVEDPRTGEVLIATYPKKPIGDLFRIEKLFHGVK
jgi:hypothetical protein